MTNTLTSSPVAPLLDLLFTQADASWSAADPALATMSDAEQTRLMRSKTDYLDFYGRMKDLPLAVSPETGTLLYMLALRASMSVSYTHLTLPTILLV